MVKRLTFFISGKEDELRNERAIAIEAVNQMGFEWTSSENRPASSKPMTQQYEKEIERSDIYLGLFGLEDSSPSRDEYELARTKNKEVLIFVKNKNDEEKRKKKLINFLKQIKEPKSGVVIDYYTDVIDLKRKIILAVANSLSEDFWFSKENKPKLTENKPKIEIIDFVLPNEITLGQQGTVTAEVRGSVKNGFLDLMLQASEQKAMWFPDQESYDTKLSTGRLTLHNEKYRKSWLFTIPKGKKTGKYMARMLMLEDKIIEGKRYRNTLHYEDRVLQVK